MAQDACFSCSILGCRMLCLTPSQQYSSPSMGEGKENRCWTRAGGASLLNQVQSYFTNKRRDVWIRNILLVLYCLVGLGGMALLTVVLVGQHYRAPARSCQNYEYIGQEKNYFCQLDLQTHTDPLGAGDLTLLSAACCTILLAVTGIFAAMKKKTSLLTAVSIGFCVAIAVQVGGSTAIVVGEVKTYDHYRYPYVPHQVQVAVKDAMKDSMLRYGVDPWAKKLWDGFQYDKCCCGMTGHRDWQVTAHTAVPESCHCKRSCDYNVYPKREHPCTSECFGGNDYDKTCRHGDDIGGNVTVPTDGCLHYLLRHIGDHRKMVMKVMYIIAFSLTSLQLFAALGPLFACCCRCCCSHKVESHWYEPLREQDMDEENKPFIDSFTPPKPDLVDSGME